jgi:hypothetical protein
MSFNFGSLANTQPASTVSYLKPYTINDNVAIKSSEIKEGTSANGNSWKCLKITFGNDEGIYSDTIFWIDVNNPKDFTEGEYETSNGGKRKTPSNWTRTSHKMAAIGFAFFPENFEKLQAVAGKFKNFDELMDKYKKMLDAAIDKKTTSMKLVGRTTDGRTFATLPSCTGTAQATERTAASNGVQVGDWYHWMSSPFGTNLTFSSYEETQRDKMLSAKPTEMKADPLLDTASNTDESDDFDLDNLL